MHDDVTMGVTSFASSYLTGPGEGQAFAPGQILAQRYRIIGLLGRGGMGEVYRADDLRLGQTVALKFLPPNLSNDVMALERFHAEVRNARQISHPNVCRMYDIADLDGRHFLSMEYVDGEDLETLLRRIGRLPGAKANEVARQLCAGLAAAHDRGVLHRDLKPANVMLDGRGRVRITDFGLALRADESTGGSLAGTPAYLAPEIYDGQPASPRSDVYALGLILYEIYTGRRPFEGVTTLVEWKERHTQSEPVLPSDRERDVDELVERVILRCLQKDPARRPSSALQVAAALPGGDAVSAALAAGETPSPEMVAASGGEGALSPRLAWSFLLGFLLLLVGIIAISPYSTDLGLSPLEKGAPVLRQRAKELAEKFGYGEHARDSASWFQRDYAPMLYLSHRDPAPAWRTSMHEWPPPVQLVYRQSPRWILPAVFGMERANAPLGGMSFDNPPHTLTGMATLVVDGTGALRYLRGEAAQIDSNAVAAPEYDWPQLFAEAGLDFSRFEPAPSVWVPPSAYDTRREWRGSAPWDATIPLRVTAASYSGEPVYFEVLGPWSRPTRQVTSRDSTPVTQVIAEITLGCFITLGIGVVAFFTRRNLRLGRIDRKGATRLAVFLLLSGALRWVFGAHHVPSYWVELQSLLGAMAASLWVAVMAALIYLSFEPYLRRRMPELLIGWARLLEGRYRDPRVGRDVLIGALLGMLYALGTHLINALPSWFPIQGQTPVPPNTSMLYGGGQLLASLLTAPASIGLRCITYFVLLFMLELAFRRRWVSIVGLVIIGTLPGMGAENPALEVPAAFVFSLLTTFAVTRLGLLAVTAMILTQVLLAGLPLPLHAGAPYNASSLIVLGVLVAFVVGAFRISLGTRPLFGSAGDAS